MKDHFKPTFIYICSMSVLILLYVVAITFLPIPEKNQRFVDISLGLLLGLLAGNTNYLTGGNPIQKKSETGATAVEKADNVTVNNGGNATMPEAEPKQPIGFRRLGAA